MNRMFLRVVWAVLLISAGLSASVMSHADAISAVQVLRIGGCGGIMPAARPIPRSATLDRVAQRWAAGSSLPAAAQLSDFRGGSTAGLHVNGPDGSMLELMKGAGCRTLASQRVREVGLYRRGLDNWIVLAFAGAMPDSGMPVGSASGTAAAGNVEVAPRTRLATSSQAPVLASRALELVNEARARGARCGKRSVRAGAAGEAVRNAGRCRLGHATDMAEHDYFEHQDLAGHSPADRVRAVGYREKLVGENIAYGPEIGRRSRCRAGSTVPATAKTSWTRASPRWVSRTPQAARSRSTDCTGCRCSPRRAPRPAPT